MIEICAAIASVINRGTLNFNPSSSTKESVLTGYYTDGTLSTENAWNTKGATMIGTVTGTGTLNISTITNRYAELTNDNFIVSLVSMPFLQTSGSQSGSRVYGRGSGFTVTKSYDASTGILTVGGLIQTIYSWDASGRNSANNQSPTANIYMV